MDKMVDISPHCQLAGFSSISRGLFASFENGQRDAAGCISAPS